MSLPTGWTDVALTDIADINPTNPDAVPSDDTLVSFVPMALVEELTGRLDPSKHRPWREVKKGFSKFQEDDIVVAKITPSMENGKAAIARGLANDLGAGTTELHVLRPRQAIEPRFLLHYVLQESFRRLARARMTGTAGQLRVPTAFLEEQRIPLPPAAEQARIVESLDSMLSRLDSAVANLKAAQRKLKAYRASVLKAAVEGRLVPTEAELARTEGRSYEPADALLDRILNERRRRWEEAELAKMMAAGKVPKDHRWKVKYSEPEPPVVADLPSLPEGWCWATAASLYWDAGYGTSAKCTEDSNGPAVLRIPNIVAGTIDLDDLKFAADDAALASDGRVQPGDFLFIRTNGSRSLIGRGAVVLRESDAPLFFASYLIRLRLVATDACDRWFALAWGGPSVRAQLLRVAASSAGQHNISLSAASFFAIPLPPAAEQARILMEFERLDSAAAVVERDIAKTIGRNSRLRQTILKWAFEGHLVDQDATDEPADVLLARIRSEREAAAPAKTIRRRSRTAEAHEASAP